MNHESCCFYPRSTLHVWSTKMFLFPLQTKVWPLCRLSPPPHPPPLPATHPPSLSLSFSLCVDNVSANDLTALVEAPSSNWTSRDWVLYRKTIVILSQISTTLRFNKTQGWTGLCGLLHSWIEEKNQVCFLLSNGRGKKNAKGRGKMGAITLLGACGLKCSLR